MTAPEPIELVDTTNWTGGTRHRATARSAHTNTLAGRTEYYALCGALTLGQGEFANRLRAAGVPTRDLSRFPLCPLCADAERAMTMPPLAPEDLL